MVRRVASTHIEGRGIVPLRILLYDPESMVANHKRMACRQQQFVMQTRANGEIVFGLGAMAKHGHVKS